MNKIFTRSLFVIATISIVSASVCEQTANPQTVGQLLCNIKENTFQGIFKLIFVFAYVSGMGLMVAGIFKLKQVKENPTQIPVSTPMALFMCAALLLYLPEIITPAGESIFGAGTKDENMGGGSSGESSFKVGSIKNLMED